MHPRFSIIIPVYNVALYLEECLDSVCNQTFTDWECLCVDDGSKDISGDILDDYVRKDARFRVTHQPNGGVSVARNRALDKASGEWVGFVDPDDRITEDRLAVVAQVAQDCPTVDWVRLWYQEWREGSCYKSSIPPENHCGKFTLQWGWERLAELSVMWINYYKRDAIRSVRFNPELTVYEDYIFELQALPHLHTVYQGKHAGYYYRILNDSAFHRPQSIDAYIKLFEALFRVLENQAHLLKTNEIIKRFTARVIQILLKWQRCHTPTRWRERIQLRNLCLKAWLAGWISPVLISRGFALRLGLFLITGWLGFLTLPLRRYTTTKR